MDTKESKPSSAFLGRKSVHRPEVRWSQIRANLPEMKHTCVHGSWNSTPGFLEMFNLHKVFLLKSWLVHKLKSITHFIAHQLRTWNKKAYVKVSALEMALGMLHRKNKQTNRKSNPPVTAPPLYLPSLISQPQYLETEATQLSK